MKVSPRTIRRSNDAHAVAEIPRDEVVISLPDPRLLRLIARSVLLAVAILSLPWLRSVLLPDPSAGITGIGSNSIEDELFYIPKLLQDMQSYGLIQSQGRSLFLGDPGIHASLLKRNGVFCLPEDKIWQIAEGRSLDFVFLVAGGFSDLQFHSIDQILTVGGVIAFRLGAHPVKPFNLPANYRMIYIQNIGRTVIAVKKLYHDNALIESPGRRLLSLSQKKKIRAIRALEDAVLEPPVLEKHRKRIKYLPELTGESLDKYPRRVFIDMGSPGRVSAGRWFEKRYPRKNQEFEIVNVDLLIDVVPGKGSGGVAEWMRKNVREKEYVVVKADAEAVEEMVRGGAIGLVDELFLECRNQMWERRKMAYWECLALFGKLRKSGVAVHQWWGRATNKKKGIH